MGFQPWPAVACRSLPYRDGARDLPPETGVAGVDLRPFAHMRDLSQLFLSWPIAHGVR